MKKFHLLFLTILILGCKYQDKSELPLFNGITFNLIEGETVAKPNSIIIDSYTSFFDKKYFPIPLFRYIDNKDYKIFIGIPYGTSVDKLKNSQLIGQDLYIVDSKIDSDSYYFKRHYKDNNYINEYVVNFEGNLVFIMSVTNSKIISDSLFSYFKISKRFFTSKE